MKVLLIKPMEHPQVVDIENSLKEFYRILDCDCITATYPWEERAALVTDDNGLFTEKSFSRYIPDVPWNHERTKCTDEMQIRDRR